MFSVIVCVNGELYPKVFFHRKPAEKYVEEKWEEIKQFPDPHIYLYEGERRLIHKKR